MCCVPALFWSKLNPGFLSAGPFLFGGLGTPLLRPHVARVSGRPSEEGNSHRIDPPARGMVSRPGNLCWRWQRPRPQGGKLTTQAAPCPVGIKTRVAVRWIAVSSDRSHPVKQITRRTRSSLLRRPVKRPACGRDIRSRSGAPHHCDREVPQVQLGWTDNPSRTHRGFSESRSAKLLSWTHRGLPPCIWQLMCVAALRSCDIL